MENLDIEREKEAIKSLMTLEDVLEKKARIHARLLMDVNLAKEMEALAIRHENRIGVLESLLTEKPLKKKNGGTMSLMNEEEEE